MRVIKRRLRTVIICEQCGNEFYRGRLVKKEDGKEYIVCPYCRYENRKIFRNRKKKRGNAK